MIQAIGLLLVYRASVQVMIVRAIVAGRCESSVSITKLSLPGDKSDLPGESCMLNKKKSEGATLWFELGGLTTKEIERLSLKIEFKSR